MVVRGNPLPRSSKSRNYRLFYGNLQLVYPKHWEKARIFGIRKPEGNPIGLLFVIWVLIKKQLMITVSSNAKEYIDRLMADKKADPTTFLRVGVKSGGCSGLEYKLDFDTVEKEGDQVFEDKGVRVVVDMKSLLYLYGTELDYSGGLNGKGLTFNNPNASRTCSCGESFSV
jgi:iron-sulfur cluster assembly protein